MAELKISNLTKVFGSQTALNNISLEVSNGEFVVMLGPNGAGKTTSLRCIAGLEKPEIGEIFINEKQVTKLPPSERNVAFVFQNYALYPRKTVYQNIAFPLESRNVPKTEIETRVKEVAELLHITRLLERKPAQLSGGEQQRVALGRALIRRAQIFLMDEPLTNLDFKLRVEMRTELKRLHEELKYTFFYVTNDQIEALTMASRVAVLNQGKIQQFGSPKEIYDRPVNRMVAGFVGFPPMNFLSCGFSSDSGSLMSTESDWRLALPKHYLASVKNAQNDELMMGVRPEDLLIKTDDTVGAIKGSVFVVEMLGDRTIVDVQVGNERMKVKELPTAHYQINQPVWLLPDLNRIHLFDRSTGIALLREEQL